MSVKSTVCQFIAAIGTVIVTAFNPALASGPVGDHVNHLSNHLDDYSKEVHWLIDQIDDIVIRYEQKGSKAAGSDAIIDHWEAVAFHSAIETNYVPVYASIWQGLIGVKDSIEKNASAATVRAEQDKLEQALWQALGAVKVAAQYQDRGLLKTIQLRDGAPRNSIEALLEIKHRLDKVVAKYAEGENKEAVSIVHDTYLNLFEGVEGELIALDADLVEDLEKDFNVTLPKAVQDKTSIDNVRAVVKTMGDKLKRCKSLLEQAKQNKKDVF
ncbi:hypothetical protein KFE80_04915 [bacterium SCSIO 12696]|nr:hypothetical protein KFE80_04915 [bacterium SCSIO 12696]